MVRLLAYVQEMKAKENNTLSGSEQNVVQNIENRKENNNILVPQDNEDNNKDDKQYPSNLDKFGLGDKFGLNFHLDNYEEGDIIDISKTIPQAFFKALANANIDNNHILVKPAHELWLSDSDII